MLNNLRRKRLQKFNIESYLVKNILWLKDIVVSGKDHASLGKQRYSKKVMAKSFEKSKFDILIPYYIVGKTTYNLIPCPSGSFLKGSDKQTNNPPQEMKIEKSFLLGETEVTQEMYESVMGNNPSDFKDDPKNPVETVSWYDALIFCNKLSDAFGLVHYYTIGNTKESYDKHGNKHIDYTIEINEKSKGFRLQTEWEWEYAAKAGTQLKYSGSDNLTEVAWYPKNSRYTTHPVKQKKPNAWGFYDMSGNVWEWCENEYKQYEKSAGVFHAIRGGSFYNQWDFSEEMLQSVYRGDHRSSDRNYHLGFRVCRYI